MTASLTSGRTRLGKAGATLLLTALVFMLLPAAPAWAADPVAVDDTATTVEGVPAVIDVLANDSDPDGDPLTIYKFKDLGGAVTRNPDDTLTYTPDPGFTGVEVFDYEIQDSEGKKDKATVTVTVTPAASNQDPVAVDDSATTNEGASVTIDVLANDSDPDGDPLTVASVSSPAAGTATTDGTTVTYTPPANWSGSDTFDYTVDDGSGGTATAGVTVTVTPAATNQDPVAVDDTATTVEGVPAVIDVLANDSDPDGDPLTISKATPSSGLVLVNGDGTLTYTPQASFTGTDWVDYTIADGNGGRDAARVTVTVDPLNLDPVAVDDTATTSGQNPVTIAVLSNDSDPDGDLLTISKVTAAGGTATINPDNSVTYVARPKFSGTDWFDYTVVDGRGGLDKGTVTVTVMPVNQDPVGLDDSATTREDREASVNVLANDWDADGDQLTLLSHDTITAAGGSVTCSASGICRYSPRRDFHGQDSFSYIVGDGKGVPATAMVRITVVSVNDAPQASDDAAAGSEDQAITLDVLENDEDPDGDVLHVIAVDPPAHGAATVNPDGTLTFVPDPDWYGSDWFAYRIHDARGGESTATVAIVIHPVNDPPRAIDDLVTTEEEQAVVISVLRNDTDPEGNPLWVASVDTPRHGSVAILDPGTVLFTPDQNFHGTARFRYLVSDGKDVAQGMVTVTVHSRDDLPVPVADVVTTPAGTSIVIHVLANDHEADGEQLRIVGFSQGRYGAVTHNGDGTLTYTPGRDFRGADEFGYVVSDGTTAVATTVTVTRQLQPGGVVERAVTPVRPQFDLEVVTAGYDDVAVVTDAVEDMARNLALPLAALGGTVVLLFGGSWVASASKASGVALGLALLIGRRIRRLGRRALGAAKRPAVATRWRRRR